MKEESKEYKLSSVVEIISGGTPKTDVSSYWDGNIPWLSVKDFAAATKYVITAEKSITEEGLNHCASNLLHKDDIIISARGTVGALAMIDCPMAFNQSCYGLRAKKGINAHFLFYLLKTKINELNKVSHGSVFNTITRNTFDTINCEIPSLHIQQKLASILSRYDDLIEVNKRRIALLEASARELYKEWFVRFRFPRYEHEAFKEGKPANWEYEPVTDILDIKYGKDHKLLDEGRVPSYGSGGIMRKVDGFLYQGEAVLIPRKGTLNNIMYVNEKFWTIDTMFYGIPKIEHSAKITYYFLSSIDMETFNSGAALPSMTTNILSGIKVLLPTSKLMADFDILTTPIFKAISNLKDANNTLSLQRDRLLPRLLSGDLSVD